MSRFVKVGAVVAVVLSLIVGGAFVVMFGATSNAKAAALSDARVEVVRDDNGLYLFSPKSMGKTLPMGLVLFPGGFADPLAYAPLARAVAEAGYPVTLVPLPRRGMFGTGWVADVLKATLGRMHEDERAARWVVAGHSMGAAVAARMAAEMANIGGQAVGGLLLIASAQPSNYDMSKYGQPVTKIFGTNDGIVSVASVEATRKNLPTNTRWVRIEGGNHAQFAWYGSQLGDNTATISADVQHQQLIVAVLETMRLASEPRPPHTY